MALTDRLGKKIRRAALGMALMTAPFAHGQENADAHEDSTNQARIVQQVEQDIFAVHAYHTQRDRGIDKEAYTAGLDYARQINAQMVKADINLDYRSDFVDGMVNYLIRPLSGNDEIKFGYISFDPTNLRQYWAQSGSSLDFSDGLKLTLKNQSKSKNSAFILDIPQDALTDSIHQLSNIYEVLQKDGSIQQLQQSAIKLSSMSSDEQKAFTDQLINKAKTASTEETTTQDKKTTDLFLKAIHTTYTISVRNSDGEVRLATKDDAELFYQTVVDNLMDMNKKGAINLGKIAQELYGGGLTGWGVRLFSKLLSDNQLRNIIDKNLKKPVITTFNEAVDRQGSSKKNGISALLEDGMASKADSGIQKETQVPTYIASSRRDQAKMPKFHFFYKTSCKAFDCQLYWALEKED